MRRDFVQVDWDKQLEDDCRQIVRLAVREDLDRSCDWTTVSLVPATARGAAHIVAREAGVVAGLKVAHAALDEMQADVGICLNKQDGDGVQAGVMLAHLTGSARDILTTERIILNFIGRLSGIATLTHRYVEQVRGTGACVYDTRKTTPGWRRLEKLAVRLGGGTNHRTGLFSAIMIKDNHLAHVDGPGLSPAAAVKSARDFVALCSTSNDVANMIVEIEVDTVLQFRHAVAASPDIILLDNMSIAELSQCVGLRNTEATEIQLEASGGVTLDNIKAIAETGVDRISVGALTHSATSFDVGLDWT